MKPEILQIAPMLPGVEAALGEAYLVHRYFDAPDRPALLAAVGPRVRGVATDGVAGRVMAGAVRTVSGVRATAAGEGDA